MRIQTQDRVRAYPYVYQKRIESIKPVAPVAEVKQIDERVLGEDFILSEVAETVMKVFIFGVAPLYILWLFIQFIRLLRLLT